MTPVYDDAGNLVKIEVGREDAPLIDLLARIADEQDAAAAREAA